MAHPAGYLLYICIAIFIFNQIAVFNIGNRLYSFHYQSHFLLPRKGLCKLIYYKPRHFDMYNLYEVLMFFMSYIVLLSGVLLAIILYNNDAIQSVVKIYGIILVLLFILGFARVILIDIQYKLEDRYFKKNGMMFQYIKHKNTSIYNKTNESIIVEIDKAFNDGVFMNRYQMLYSYRKDIENCTDASIVNNEYITLYKHYKDVVPIKKRRDGTYKFMVVSRDVN